jgi:hypothetical protein
LIRKGIIKSLGWLWILRALYVDWSTKTRLKMIKNEKELILSSKLQQFLKKYAIICKTMKRKSGIGEQGDGRKT